MVTLVSPYTNENSWYRGNLHTHTTQSDGSRSVDDVVIDYERRGYDFLAVSDHDIFVDPDDYRDRTEMALLPAVEVSANGPHLQHLDASDAIDPVEDRQTVIDGIDERGGLAVLNHPNWGEAFSHWTQEELNHLTGYLGIEIYNGTIERLPGSALATDRWDQLLSTGRRVWGFANDDAHRAGEVACAWNVVQAADLTPEAIIEALSAGRFYASTGVTIREIDVTDTTITVGTDGARQIRLVSDHGIVQQTTTGSVATFRIPDQLVYRTDHTYVRVECFDGGQTAWTQPIFLEDESDE